MDKFEILENIELKPFTTLKLGGTGKFFATAQSEKDIVAGYEFARSKNIPIFPLGGGSNIVVRDRLPGMLFLKMENSGITIIKEDNSHVWVRVLAGTNWDEFVLWSVNNAYCGIEALSFIPGTVGATPVQNVNAYGAEVASTIDRIRFLNTENGRFIEIDSDGAKFEYRDSVFKHELKGKVIIESIIFRLHKTVPEIPDYPNVKERVAQLSEMYPENDVLKNIRNAIIEIRKEKLPDPNYVSNVGSFFTNPILSPEHFDSLRLKYPDIKFFETTTGYKIPAGWLIEKAGLKGASYKGVGTYEKHALVLVNNSAQSTDELLEFVRIIQDNIFQKFGIKLEIEPEII